MEFPVPQFIEHEAKIVGPLTFKQFIFVGIAGGICLLLYLYASFWVFILLSILLLGIGIALAFLKVNGKPLPLILTYMFKFGLHSKIYIWQKKDRPATAFKKEKGSFSFQKKEEKEEGLPLKIAQRSRIKKLNTQIEANFKK